MKEILDNDIILDNEYCFNNDLENESVNFLKLTKTCTLQYNLNKLFKRFENHPVQVQKGIHFKRPLK